VASKVSGSLTAAGNRSVIRSSQPSDVGPDLNIIEELAAALEDLVEIHPVSLH
jgi:hypothetical protein